MSILSKVGQRSARMRVLTGGIYLLLSAGALTMVVPFLLMISIATTSEGDFRDFELTPAYWTDDLALFRKVVVDAAKLEASSVWAQEDRWFAPTDVKASDFEEIAALPVDKRRAQADDLRVFLDQHCPPYLRRPLYVPNPDSPFTARESYWKFLRAKYGTLEAANRAHADNAADWNEFALPEEQPHRLPAPTAAMADYLAWVATLPADRVTVFLADVDVFAFLKTIELPKELAGSSLVRMTYEDLADPRLPSDVRKRFFVERAPTRYVIIDVRRAASAWRDHLAKLSPEQRFPLTSTMPIEPAQASTWARFIQTNCPVAALDLDRPETRWRAFLTKKYGRLDQINDRHGTAYASIDEVRIPQLALLYDHFADRKSEIRTAYLTHNFRTVIDFIAVHGNALRNTVILIVLSIVGSLTVNPLAAYALSRFRLKESHQVLVFLLATMAFPAEVLMIPGFLQIKDFPIAQILAAVACMVGFILLSQRLTRLRPVVRTTLALVVTALVAGWLVPMLANMAQVNSSVSLMNTFWALVLPGLASGYGIFLLKGFFDSLPPELYEAGLLDGASEILMFRRITMPLCKPILAVMALGSFTSAYGAFMHAFLVAQDPKMWTLMVFLYEFQQTRTLPMVMASLVVAAIPTLLVFILCQRVILQGIVIPTYK